MVATIEPLGVIVFDQERDLAEHGGGARIRYGDGGSPFLILVEAAGEIREEAVHPHLLYPELVLRIWILVEIQMQELVLVPVRVRMYLPNIPNQSSYQDPE